MSNATQRFCRLSIIFAAHAPVAVIFRRGPTEWCQAIRWNTLRDEFEPGQWLHGKVYPERCALSPHGELMVYFAYKSGGVNEAGGYRREFTAVSRPPYFTALSLWPWIATWGGGGVSRTTRPWCWPRGKCLHRTRTTRPVGSRLCP